MFAAAYSQASAFTKPVIISHVRPDGQCFAGIGSFVVVNDDGWFLTAAHVFTEFENLNTSKNAAAAHAAAEAAIRNDTSLLLDQKKKRLRALGQLDPKGATDFSFWWASDAVAVQNVTRIVDADIAVGRLVPFDPGSVANYPVFKDPAKRIASGTSLCRLGFPFHEIKPTYKAGIFTLPPETFPVVFFPNEGILTRALIIGQTAEVFTGFIETSSPGLRGQSGGPIFDQHGTVWAIQSHTSHLPLGFSPPVPNGKPGEKEHQFLNVGRGTHPATIVGLLTKLGVKHTLSDY